MSEKFDPASDYEPEELCALIDVDCDQPNCHGECEVDILPRLNKVIVWCSTCQCDLGEKARSEHGIPRDAPLLVRPTFNLSAGTLKHVDDYARALAMAESPHHQVFVIGDTFSVVQHDGTVEELNPTSLRIRLSEVAQSRTKRGWADPPVTMVEAIMQSAADQTAIPKLERVNTVPVFMSDGRILDTPGYDPQSKTYYAPTVQGIVVPDVVTEEDIQDAVQLLTVDYLGDIAFKTDADLANTMACMLLAFVRTLVGPTPLHVFDSPGPGHGKTQTCESALIPGSGPNVEAISWAHSSAEQTKKIFSALRKAPNAMFIDNVTGTVESEALEMILTSPNGYYTERVLGSSKTERVPVHQTWTMTTNNGRMGKSMQRRAVWVRIDAAVEHPMLRKGPTPTTKWRHPHGLVEWGTEHRAELVSACLVLCKWWMQNDMPEPVIPPTAVRGSYERWQYVLGGILQLAGINGFCENAYERDMFNDQQSELSLTLSQLRDVFGENQFNARDVFSVGIVQAKGAQGVGVLLSNHVDEIAGGLVLRKHPTTRGGDEYSVEEVHYP